MIVSLARIDVVFAVNVVSLLVGKKRERAADHVDAEHIVIFAVVAALGLQSNREIDVACNVCDEVDKFGRLDVFDDLFEQFEDGKQIHVAVKLVIVACVLDKLRAHVVEQCRNLNIRVNDELDGTIYVAAIVRLRLDDEKLLVGEAGQERFKHCAQIDVVFFAGLELRGDVDGFAERKSIDVVHIGVLCKLVAAKHVRTGVGECDIKVLDRKAERKRRVVFCAVRNEGFVCECARNELVDIFCVVARNDNFFFRRAENFAAVAFAVVNDFHRIGFVCGFVEHNSVFCIASYAVKAHVGSDCTHIATVAFFDVVAVFVRSEHVVRCVRIFELADKSFFVLFGCRIDGIFVVSVAVESESHVNGEVDAVGRVEFDLHAAVDFLIEQVFDIESEQIFGDVFEDRVEELVSELQGEQVFVDEH